MKAEYYATVINGKISLLTNASPPHELTRNQFPLTESEYYILRAVRGVDGNLLEKMKQVRDSLEKKLAEINDKNK